MADIPAKIEGFMKNLGAMPMERLIPLVALLGMSIAGILVFFLWARTAEYQVLFSNLDQKDAAEVVEQLKARNIPYRLSADGATILVSSDHVHDARLQLASEGLPQGGSIGFELFDQTAIGTTNFVQQVNFRRALQGELSRTLRHIDGVDSARVHLVIPERTLFSDETNQPRASIVLTLRGNRTLSAQEIQGITRLVSSAVPALTPRDVTVMDTKGHLYTRGGDEQESQLVGLQREHQRALEKDLEARIQSMLERVVGLNKAVVRVSAVLEDRQIEKTEERYDPDSQVARSEQRSKDDSRGGTVGAGGVPGVLSNLPTQENETNETIVASAGGGSTNKRQTETINYEINKVVSRIVEPAGAIKRLSVAALVDGSYAMTEGPNGELVSTYTPRSEDEIARMLGVVKSAMGYSEERGDIVEVVNIPFTQSEEFLEPAPDVMGALAPWLSMLKPIGAGILLIILLLFFIRPTVRELILAGRQSTQIQAALPQPVSQLEGAFAGPKPDEVINRMADDVVMVVQQKPQAATAVVKRWLGE